MTKSNNPAGDKSPAVAVAHETLKNKEDFVILSTGDKAIVHPVSLTLISEVTSRVKDPDVPMFFNEQKGREEPNPNHPDYIRALQEADNQRGIASLDAMVMFGIELLEGIPEDRGWLKKLKILERRGVLDLSVYDLEDEIDLEFLYKRFIAVSNTDLAKVSKISGISSEEVASAEKSF